MHKLQIKTLSPTGELLHVVSCLAGGLTVLRGYAPSDLAPYQRLFASTGGPDRFALTLDGQSFDPKDATRIGFAEDISHERIPLSDFLISSGVPKSALLSAAQAFGLEAALKNNCNQLSADHVRRAELLAATYVPRSKVLVLNNIFEPIVSTWRERIAEQLLRYAQSSPSITLVTSLDYRPETWVNNPKVFRVQLGENEQKTIGFSSQPAGNEVIANALRDIRSEYGSSQDKTIAPVSKTPQQEPQPMSKTVQPPPVAAPPQTPPVQKNHLSATEKPTFFLSSKNALLKKIRSKPAFGSKKYLRNDKRFIGAALMIFFGVGAALAALKNLDSKLSEESIAKNTQEGVVQEAVQANTPEPSPALLELDPAGAPLPTEGDLALPGDTQKDLVVPAAQQPAARKHRGRTVTQASFLIDSYPQLVRSAIVHGFDSKIAPSPKFVESSAVATPGTQATSSDADSMDLFRSLEKLSSEDSSPGGGGSSYSSSSDQSSAMPESDASLETLEERRQRIREKFLEAIERRSAGSSVQDLE